MRSLPLVLPLLLAAACHTLSTEERDRLAAFQRNASLYFEAGKYDQALGLVERGLAVEPDDYKLRTIEAAIHLRLSGPASSRDQRALDRSLAGFEAVYAERSLAHHDRYLLFYYALARQKQGMRRFAEAAAANDSARAVELREQANDDLAGAKALLGELHDRGELPRLCQYHLLQIAALTNDTAAILTHGNLYLQTAAQDQQRTEQEVDRTTVYEYEVEQKAALKAMRDEEIAVRTLMAQQLFAQRDFAAALPHVDAVLAIDPTRSDDHYNRGLILRELGRLEESKSDLRAFLETTQLPPDSPKVADAVRALTR